MKKQYKNTKNYLVLFQLKIKIQKQKKYEDQKLLIEKNCCKD